VGLRAKKKGASLKAFVRTNQHRERGAPLHPELRDIASTKPVPLLS